MAKKVRVSSKGQIVIPKSYRDALSLTEGSHAVMMLREDSIVLVNVERFAELSRGRLRGTWGANRKEIDRVIESARQSWE